MIIRECDKAPSQLVHTGELLLTDELHSVKLFMNQDQP